MKEVIIVGGGFAGLNAAKELGNKSDINVTVIDKRNHHLFQPLLYQVAMAGLSPAEIAAPIRSLLSEYRNIRVYQDEVTHVDHKKNILFAKKRTYSYDYLILACGAQHSYFGNDQWEEFAPGLKTIEQATEIRRRVLDAFESAEIETDKNKQNKLLTFVIVGGGPTGVELAGAIGEMSRFTLSKDFKNIDPKLTRIILVEASDRILSTFDNTLSSKAVRDLENLGVQVWTSRRVTEIGADGVTIGDERINSATVLWAAGVQASEIGKNSKIAVDNAGRVIVESDLSLKDAPNVFIAGDQAHVKDSKGEILPSIAPVAMQQGKYLGKHIQKLIQGNKQSRPFIYFDKGKMATIGRSKAIVETGGFKLTGFTAWVTWLVIHIYYLTGLKNRLFVTISWAWSYLSFRRGARLIISRNWRMNENKTTIPKER